MIDRLRVFGSALLGALTLAACAAPAPKSKAVSVHEIGFPTRGDPISYMHVRAEFVYKPTGEPLVFDYIAACGTGQLESDGFISAGVIFPTIKVEVTPDGKGLAGLVTPHLCQGEPGEVGGALEYQPDAVPPDFMPVLIWYPDPEVYEFGLGHVTAAAYESPYARFEFKSASTTKATADEWARWKADVVKDFQPFGAHIRPQGYSGEYGSFTDEACVFRRMRFTPAPEDVAFLRAAGAIPAEGYTVPNAEAQAYLNRLRLDDPDPSKRAARIYEKPSPGAYFIWGSEYGAINRKHGGLLRVVDTEYNRFADVFPVIPTYFGPDGTPLARPPAKVQTVILDRPEWNGFATCGTGWAHAPDLQAFAEGKASEFKAAPPLFRLVKGESAQDRRDSSAATLCNDAVPNSHLVNDTPIQNVPECRKMRGAKASGPHILIDASGRILSSY